MRVLVNHLGNVTEFNDVDAIVTYKGVDHYLYVRVTSANYITDDFKAHEIADITIDFPEFEHEEKET